MAERKIVIAGFQQRRDTKENWETKNPVLRDGEQITVIFQDGSTQHKTGYGGKTYSELPFDNAESCEPSKSVNATLLANGWNNGKQTVSVAGLKATHNGVVGLPQAFTTAEYKAVVGAEMYVSAQATGSLTIACMGDTPKIDIPIVIILLG